MRIGYTARKTDYPEIFTHSYWGWFQDTAPECFEPEIIKARNNFIKEFNIVGAANLPRVPRRLIEGLPTIPYCGALGAFRGCGDVGRCVDHQELYRTRRGGRVLVLSPYQTEEDVSTKLAIAAVDDGGLGMVLYHKLYTRNAITLVKEFSSNEAVKMWLGQVWRLGCSINNK